MSATVTLQPLPEYVVPVKPYVAVTVLLDVGPKLVPVNVMVAPPRVDIEEPPATPVNAGTTYDVVPLEDALT